MVSSGKIDNLTSAARPGHLMYRNTSWWQTVNYLIIRKVLPTVSQSTPTGKAPSWSPHLPKQPRQKIFYSPMTVSFSTITVFH